jgi:hypothetical protein
MSATALLHDSSRLFPPAPVRTPAGEGRGGEGAGDKGHDRGGAESAASRTRLVRATEAMLRYISRRLVRRMRASVDDAMAHGGLWAGGCGLRASPSCDTQSRPHQPLLRRRRRQPEPSGHRRVDGRAAQRICTRTTTNSSLSRARSASQGSAWRIAASARRPPCWVGGPLIRHLVVSTAQQKYHACPEPCYSRRNPLFSSALRTPRLPSLSRPRRSTQQEAAPRPPSSPPRVLPPRLPPLSLTAPLRQS